MSYRHVKKAFTEIVAKQSAVPANLVALYSVTVIGAKRVVRFGGLNSKAVEAKRPGLFDALTPTYSGFNGYANTKDYNTSTYNEVLYSAEGIITYDLGAGWTPKQVLLCAIFGQSLDTTRTIRFEHSSDNVNWVTIASITITTYATRSFVAIATSLNRYVRFYISLGTQGTFYLYEFSAFDQIVQTVFAPSGGFAELIVQTLDIPIVVAILGNTTVSYYVYDIDHLKVSEIEGVVE